MEIFALLLIIAICVSIGEAIDDFSHAMRPYMQYLKDHLYLFGGIAFSAAALFVLIYYKPHPVEKHLEAYKQGKLTRAETVEKVLGTMSVNRYPIGKVPSATISKIMEKRVRAANRRVKAERELIEELIRYMKAKARIE
jgi:hypothetical protein